jgi:hypothetical protein
MGRLFSFYPGYASILADIVAIALEPVDILWYFWVAVVVWNRFSNINYKTQKNYGLNEMNVWKLLLVRYKVCAEACN